MQISYILSIIGYRLHIRHFPGHRNKEETVSLLLRDPLLLFTFMRWRRKWQPTPVFLPGESQGWGSLVGCSLWGRTESDTTEATQQQQQTFFDMEKSWWGVNLHPSARGEITLACDMGRHFNHTLWRLGTQSGQNSLLDHPVFSVQMNSSFPSTTLGGIEWIECPLFSVIYRVALNLKGVPLEL